MSFRTRQWLPGEIRVNKDFDVALGNHKLFLTHESQKQNILMGEGKRPSQRAIGGQRKQEIAVP